MMSLGFWWISSCGVTLHWGCGFFRERFYWRYSHSTWYSALGHTPLIDDILRHSCLIGDGLWFILEHSYLRWFILENSRHGECFSWEHSHPIGSFTLGHSHLVGGFDIEAWLPVCDYCFSMDYKVIDTSGLVFSAYLDDLGYLPTFHFILSCFLFYQSLIITFFYPTHPTVTHDLTLFSIRRRHRSVLDHLGCVFIHSFGL